MIKKPTNTNYSFQTLKDVFDMIMGNNRQDNSSGQGKVLSGMNNVAVQNENGIIGYGLPNVWPQEFRQQFPDLLQERQGIQTLTPLSQMFLQEKLNRPNLPDYNRDIIPKENQTGWGGYGQPTFRDTIYKN